MTARCRVNVRRERAGDEPAIARVNEEGFGRPDEARIVDAARTAGHVAISLVAEVESRIVGHILFTPVTIESQTPPPLHPLGLGPMAVLPPFQRQGIGSILVQAGLRECAHIGCRAVVVIGHPTYYPRFGFRPASAYALRSEFPVPEEVFMVIELEQGALAHHAGLVSYVREFSAAQE